jgi:hypothetical protein
MGQASGTSEQLDRRASTEPATFTDALASCRAALHGAFAPIASGGGGGAPPPFSAQECEAVRVLARHARAAEIPPERLIALFKGELRNLPSLGRNDPEARGEVVRRLVQLVIEAYYTSGAATPTSR